MPPKKKKHKLVVLPLNISKEVVVVCHGGPLGLKVTQIASTGFVVIKSFHLLPSGEPGPAERNGSCKVGDALLSINDESVEGLTYAELLERIRTSTRPMTMRFGKMRREPSKAAAAAANGAALPNGAARANGAKPKGPPLR